MTASARVEVRRSAVAVRALTVAVAAAGCVLLVARPLLWRATGRPVATLLALFVALLVVGVCWPVDASRASGSHGLASRASGSHGLASRASDWLTPVPVLVVGLAAFACGRLLGGGEAPTAALLPLIALNTLAAVAEEAFFRRFLYAVLLPAGALVAVIGTAALFALVHVTVYGLWVLPIDLLAGLVLSWQRWASGSWKVPAVTHVMANVMVVI